MKKKIVALILLVALVTSLGATFAACDWDEGLTITFYHTMNQSLQDIMDKYIKEFNKIYPDIKVKHEAIGGYNDVLEQVGTEIQSRDGGPNITYCYPDHVARYNVSKAVLTLDSYIDSTEKVEVGTFGNTEEQPIGLGDTKNDFIKGYYDEGKQFGDDKMYMMPWSKSTEVFYFNKTFFDAHAKDGLQLPDHWFTKDGKTGTDSTDTTSMEYVCAKIKELDPGCIPLGYDSEDNWFITMCEQLGTPYTSATGDHYLFNTAENRAFAETFNRWYKNQWVTTQTLYGKYTSKLFTVTAANQMKCYMVIGSSGGSGNQVPAAVDGKYPFDVGIKSIPQENPDNPKVISQGPSVCILKHSAEENLASWLFVKYLTTNIQFQSEFAIASGYVPVIKTVNEDAVYSAHLKKANGNTGITAYAAKVCLEQADAYYTSPAFDGSSKARQEVSDLLVKCLKATQTGQDLTRYIEEQFAAKVQILNHG